MPTQSVLALQRQHRIAQCKVAKRLLGGARQRLEALTDVDAVTLSRYALKVTAALGSLPLSSKPTGFLLVDTTSVRVGTRRRDSYSGHKHQRCAKVQLVCDEAEQVAAVGRAWPGSVHDKTVFDREGVRLASTLKSVMLADKAYVGGCWRRRGAAAARQARRESLETRNANLGRNHQSPSSARHCPCTKCQLKSKLNSNECSSALFTYEPLSQPMFKSIDFKKASKSEMFGYVSEKKLPFFKVTPRVEFKPGLNILFGPNGCGKSTIVRALAHTMSAYQGGVSTVTETSMRDMVNMSVGSKSGPTDAIGLSVEHDGQPVVFSDPRLTVGLTGSHFDDDFFFQGISEIQKKHLSHGNMSMSRIERALAILIGRAEFPSAVEHKLKRTHVNEMWRNALDVVDARMKGNIEPGQPTLLFDEPETNFSLLWQAGLWRLFERVGAEGKFQVIVATHSPFALNIKGAHYIEMEPGYREKVLEEIKELASR